MTTQRLKADWAAYSPTATARDTTEAAHQLDVFDSAIVDPIVFPDQARESSI